jgi:hypothetical protein
MWWEYYVLMNENGEVRPAETVLGMRGGGIKENDGGVNSTVIYCKHVYKCLSVLAIQQYNFKNK